MHWWWYSLLHVAGIPITIPLPFHSECTLCFGTGKDSVWFSIRNWITWFQFHCQLTFTPSDHIFTRMYTYVWGIHRISLFQYTHHFSCGWGKTKTVVFSLPLILVFNQLNAGDRKGGYWHWLNTKKHNMKVHWLVTKHRVHTHQSPSACAEHREHKSTSKFTYTNNTLFIPHGLN